DAEDATIWRMPKRRLQAEAIRDAMLSVSGQMDLTPRRGSAVDFYEGQTQQLARYGALQLEENKRSVYLPIIRDQVPDALAVFDFAETSIVIGEREDTTVPAQALYLMNSPFVAKQAEGMAKRLLANEMNVPDRIKLAFQLAFNRLPTDYEIKTSTAFLDKFASTEMSGKDSRFASK